MATLTIRNLDDDLKDRLRRRAAANERSVQDEVRVILASALAGQAKPQHGIGQSIAAYFSSIDGDNVDLPARVDLPRAADLPE
jgi:plasmid stability protein